MPSSTEKRKEYNQQVRLDAAKHALSLERRRQRRAARQKPKAPPKAVVIEIAEPAQPSMPPIPRAVPAEIYRVHGLFAPLFALQAAR